MKIDLFAGQRWAEVDSRFTRVVQIISVNADGTVSTRTVNADGSLSAREYRPRASRFHGKSGGYVKTGRGATSKNGACAADPELRKVGT